MEGEAVRLEAQVARADQQVAGHVQRTPELVRERPVGALVVHQDAAVDLGAGRGLGQLVRFRRAVEGE